MSAVNANQNANLDADIKALTDKYGKGRDALISILRGVQEKYHYISDVAMQQIAYALNIHAIEVQDVASFYSFLSLKPKGKFIVRMCQTLSCKMNKAAEIAQQFEKELGIKFGETTKDGIFTLEWTNCIGMCDQGPALLVNDTPHTKVTPEQVKELIKQYRGK
jgi:NADH:ubiquinone oxidoreductase subunit E